MPNYQNSKIYKIINDSMPNKIYYGSTTQPLSGRIRNHKKQKNCSSSILFDSGNPKMILVKNYPCNSKEELLREERKFIEENDCLNKNIPLQTRKEYREKNKEKLAQEFKKYYEENKNYLNKLPRKYIKYTCECGSTVNKRYLKRHERSDKHKLYLSEK